MVANTGDDVEFYGVHVAPDPDLITYWLADAIDARGWGMRDDTLQVDGRAARRRPATPGSTSAIATSPTACSAPSCCARAGA